MTDPIILRARRKSELREAFRTIEQDPDRGPGTVVLFANWSPTHPHVDATLQGLLSTGSITEPVRDEHGRAVVRILEQDEEPVEPSSVDLTAATVDIATQTSKPSGPDLAPPPQAGAGSGVENWREYAATALPSRPAETWADMPRSEIIGVLESEGVAV